MCGIAGFYGYKNDELLKRFSRQLKHRGPDGEGMYTHDGVSLLIRRLAIIDIKGGNQPIYNENKLVVVICNGEIYNYQELRKELESKGHTFQTHSDTEVIVHGYEEWGETCFDKFNGMFGIALYDIKSEKLILARDHFGIKPLYFSYIQDKNSQSAEKVSLVFSSEIKPIFYSGLIKKKPNERILYRYLKYRIHDDQEETFFDGIYRLMPGQMLVLKNGVAKKSYFSNLESELLKVSEKNTETFKPEHISEFKNKLQEAIRLRLISDVPVGTCLSGGLDSSTVVATANSLLQNHRKEAESLGDRQKTFSAVFPGSSNNEEMYIDELIKSVKKIHSYKVQPKPEEFFNEIEDFIQTQEEPTISTGPYAQYKVMQMAQGKATVLLDGQGADEMLAGYLPYYFVYLRQLRRQGKFITYFNEVMQSKDVIFKYLFRKPDPFANMSSLLQKEFAGKFKNETFQTERKNLKKRLIEDIFHNSLQSLLRYEDKNTMRFSIEGRVPFLDFNLVRYIFSLPDEAIISKGWNKNILRLAVRGLVPENIQLRRNKIGFTTPENEWFIRMKNRIYSMFLSESFATRPYFNQPAVVKVFLRFIEGKNDDTLLFWRILNVELWLRAFFDVSKKPIVEEKVVVNKKNEIVINEGKNVKIEIEDQSFLRFPVKTDVFKKGDDSAQKIAKYTIEGIHAISRNEKFNKVMKNHWFAVVSEKVVAISQGRSYFIWDIKPSFLASKLSKFVTRTPYGIGLGSPWTMELAIKEVGIIRIFIAAVIAALTKPFGIKGAFYFIAGRAAAAIDGPTEYSLYPSNVSAKLGPKNPKGVAKQIHNYLLEKLPKTRANTFRGVVIIDANDIGQIVLGNTTGLKNKKIENIFKDNPMGQGSEQTPVVIVFEDSKSK